MPTENAPIDEFPAAIYDDMGDPIEDDAYARRILTSLGWTVLGPFGTRPGDDARGDPGYWVRIPAPDVPRIQQDGTLVIQPEDSGDWTVVLG